MFRRFRNYPQIGGKRALPYDAEVEYIEGDGTVLIDTGYVPHVPIDETYVAECTRPKFEASWKPWFGNSAIESERDVLFRFRTSYDSLQSYIPRSDANYFAYTSLPFAEGVKLTVVVNNSGSFVNSRSLGVYAKLPGASSITNKSVKLFGHSSTTECSKMKFYRFYVTKGASSFNERTHDFIPVRKNGLGYFYDLIGGTLHGNVLDEGRGVRAELVGPDKAAS